MATFIHLSGRWLNVEQIQQVSFASGEMTEQPQCEVIFEGNSRLTLTGDDATRLDEFLRRYEGNP